MTDPYGPPQPNPYQPDPYQPSPTTQVASGKRPGTLTAAVVGMWLGLVVSVGGAVRVLLGQDAFRDEMRTAMQKSFDRQSTPPDVDVDHLVDTIMPILMVLIVVFALIAAGLWIWMAIANGRGIAWARVLATVFGAISVLSSISSVANAATLGTTNVGAPGGIEISAFGLLIDVAILVLLWLPASSAYYSERSAARAAARSAATQ